MPCSTLLVITSSVRTKRTATAAVDLSNDVRSSFRSRRDVDEDDGAAVWTGRAVGLQADPGHGRCFVVGQGDLGVDHHRPGPVGHGEGDDESRPSSRRYS